MNDLEKARQLLLDKSVKLIDVSKETSITPPTLSNYVTHPEKLQKATWINIHKLANVFNRINKISTNEKEDDIAKVQKLLNNRSVSLKELSNKLDIPYITLRSWVSYPTKMPKAAWSKVHKLAIFYDTEVKDKPNVK